MGTSEQQGGARKVASASPTASKAAATTQAAAPSTAASKAAAAKGAATKRVAGVDHQVKPSVARRTQRTSLLSLPGADSSAEELSNPQPKPSPQPPPAPIAARALATPSASLIGPAQTPTNIRAAQRTAPPSTHFGADSSAATGAGAAAGAAAARLSQQQQPLLSQAAAASAVQRNAALASTPTTTGIGSRSAISPKQQQNNVEQTAFAAKHPKHRSLLSQDLAQRQQRPQQPNRTLSQLDQYRQLTGQQQQQQHNKTTHRETTSTSNLTLSNLPSNFQLSASTSTNFPIKTSTTSIHQTTSSRAPLTSGPSSISNILNKKTYTASTKIAKMTDQAVIDKLEAGFAKLQAATPEQCHSLLKKYLTREVLDQLKTRKTAMGATLLDVAQSGFENLDSGVGIYAPDAESYTLFAELFNPIIEDYHGGFKPTDKHPASDFGDLETLVNVDPANEYVISTRVRCGRSLKGYPFNPCLTEAQYKEMEDKVSSTLKELKDDLAGTYYPLTGMTKETQQQLIDDHFLFKEGDRFLQAANACRYWPTGRGIYHNEAKSFLVWVNEEDHLRIISMQKGGDLKTIFGRLVKGVRSIEAKVPFSRDDRLGFLTFCPTNLGTTIRASVHIKLPKLAADRKKLEEVAGKFNLQVRGTSGEHTESVGGVYDISNKRRLGLTEYQAVREMQDGILELIKIEKSL